MSGLNKAYEITANLLYIEQYSSFWGWVLQLVLLYNLAFVHLKPEYIQKIPFHKKINTLKACSSTKLTNQTNPPSMFLFSGYRCCVVIVWLYASLLEEGLGPKQWLSAPRWQCSTWEGKASTRENSENVSFETEPMCRERIAVSPLHCA